MKRASNLALIMIYTELSRFFIFGNSAGFEDTALPAKLGWESIYISGLAVDLRMM